VCLQTCQPCPLPHKSTLPRCRTHGRVHIIIHAYTDTRVYVQQTCLHAIHMYAIHIRIYRAIQTNAHIYTHHTHIHTQHTQTHTNTHTHTGAAAGDSCLPGPDRRRLCGSIHRHWLTDGLAQLSSRGCHATDCLWGACASDCTVGGGTGSGCFQAMVLQVSVLKGVSGKRAYFFFG
jgi:hypothetical protein